ncbi:uncharacterized protein [Dysidea avara]|uniref:uncharacterized protein n=1 Tax=Dysidea avara TaxID=196820 RepID=UPI00332D07C6
MQTEIEESPFRNILLDQWSQQWIEELTKSMPPDGRNYKFHPVVESFRDAIESSAELTMHFTQMFIEKPGKYKAPNQVKDYYHMIQLLDHILTKAPEYNDNFMAIFPITAILSRPLETVSGHAAFLNATVNHHIKSILNVWSNFLRSPESCYVLTTNGWFSTRAMDWMGGNFERDFMCDPSKPHCGFTSWDDFFTRQFRPHARPVAYPDDNKVIVNPCEAAPFRIESNVTKHGTFWIKGTPYNIKLMLADDSLTDRFVGGTVYQGFLNANTYHRWHSPVNGKIVKAYVEDGTYYSLPLIDGYENLTNPPVLQHYLANVHTRALMFIKADNPYIGLMCFMAVGMMDVSSCEITIAEGQKVQKGQQTGMFHYGGSSFCLVFRPGVELEFDLHGETPGLTANNILINTRIATVPQ